MGKVIYTDEARRLASQAGSPDIPIRTKMAVGACDNFRDIGFIDEEITLCSFIIDAVMMHAETHPELYKTDLDGHTMVMMGTMVLRLYREMCGAEEFRRKATLFCERMNSLDIKKTVMKNEKA